jgi:hypothetical protein
MKKYLYSFIFFVSLAGSCLFGQNAPLHPTKIQHAVYFDTSIPLRDMQIIPPTTPGEEGKEIPNKLNRNDIPGHKSIPFTFPGDPALQKQDATYRSLLLTPIQNFDGMPNILGYYPPDTQGDVSTDFYVQVVNINFQIWTKAGVSVFGPANLNTIWAGIPAPFDGSGDGDPVVLFDQAANRWIISEFGLRFDLDRYSELVAVSQTSDPTGAWYRYVFDYGEKMPDYPKFGIWPDGYYMSANQFINNDWGGVGVTALERTKLIAGDPTAQMVYFDLTAAGDPWSMLPSDWDGPTSPVVNEPNHFSYFNDWTGPDDYLRVWDFHVDWVTPANSTFGQVANLTTAPFNENLCVEPTGRGRCIPQPGTAQKLESLSDRLMYRLQYRKFGTHASMVTNHTVNVGGGVAGVRWYELQNAGGGWSIYQQGTWSPDADYRWVGSIAMNSVGDIALGYSVASSTLYPSIRYTGRKPGDPLGTMSISEQTVINGSGSQTGTEDRWGDYSMMSVDPSDDVTFWFTTEYIQSTGPESWKTRIASFNISNAPLANSAPATAVATTTATLNGSVNPNSLLTNYHFEYGTTMAYGSSTPTLSAGSGTSAVPVSANITGLSSGSTYHFRLDATNTDGTSNSSELTFIPGGAILTTTALSSIKALTATSGGNITNNGGFAITGRGVCWGMELEPTIADPHTSNGSGTGTFVSAITGLSPGTHYHVRAYATSSAGTFYGDDLNFTSTTGAGNILTTVPTDITKLSASSGGDITFNGGYGITARGVCWGLSANPTILDSHTTNGSGVGVFVSSMTGLTSGTHYHVRAYATNAATTFYGDDLAFYTLCDPFILPFNETFSYTEIPLCWTQFDHAGNGMVWQFGNFTSPYNPPYDAPVLNGNYAYLNSDTYGSGNTENADLITPTLDLSDNATVTLTFNYYFLEYDSENASVSYSTDDGATWVSLAVFPPSTNNPESFSQNIPAAAGQQHVKFMWNYTGTYGYWYAIDNVRVTGLPINSQLSDITVPNDSMNCYNASQTIMVGGSGTSFLVQTGGNATLIAGLKIDMLPGTKVNPGGYLHGYIAPLGPFCINPDNIPIILGNNNDDNPETQAVLIEDLFKVYPNPTSGSFTLELLSAPDESIASVKCYNMIGSLILEKNYYSGMKHELTLFGNAPGIYLLRIMMNGKTGTRKIIKQ